MSPCKGDLSLRGSHVSASSRISADGWAVDLSDGPGGKTVPSHVGCHVQIAEAPVAVQVIDAAGEIEEWGFQETETSIISDVPIKSS